MLPDLGIKQTKIKKKNICKLDHLSIISVNYKDQISVNFTI